LDAFSIEKWDEQKASSNVIMVIIISLFFLDLRFNFTSLKFLCKDLSRNIKFSSYLEAITTDNDVLPKLMFLTTLKNKSCQVFQFITDFAWTTLEIVEIGQTTFEV
jgi:cyanate permease